MTESIPHALVLSAVERMAAELFAYLPAEEALERARNIGQALADGHEDVEGAVIEMLTEAMSGHEFRDRVLAIVRVVAAWERETARCDGWSITSGRRCSRKPDHLGRCSFVVHS